MHPPGQPLEFNAWRVRAPALLTIGMPELRTDWLTGRTVFVAETRAERPYEFGNIATVDLEHDRPLGNQPSCPFCPGQEHLTPASVYEMAGDDGKWHIRVVPNKFPAVTAPSDVAILSVSALDPYPVHIRAATREPHALTQAVGAHEVFIESPRHVTRLSALSVPELSNVLQAYAARLQHWRGDGRLGYALVFKNQGALAGASLAHLHSQFIALPTVPVVVNDELSRAEHDWRTLGICAYCRLIEQETLTGDRLIFNRDGFIAFCPHASLQPYETWLLPSRHLASFEETEPEKLNRLAGVVHSLVTRIETVVPTAAYNMLLRTAPWCGDCGQWFHWRIELLPRVTSLAGLELATGIFINPLAPERAASKLRSV